MKTIKIKELTLQGFGSYSEHTNIKLNEPGLFIIKGENGVGKSTFIAAIFFALFNKSLKQTNIKDVVTWESLRGKEWKGTRVVVDLEIDNIEYSIANHINWTGGKTFGVQISDGIIISENGEIVDSFFHKNDLLKHIERLLGINAKTFINSVVFPQRMVRLLQSSEAEQKAILESFYDIEWVDDAQKYSLEKYKEIVNKYESNIKTIDTLKNQLASQQETIYLFKEKLHRQAANAEEKIEKLTNELKELKAKEAENIKLINYTEIEIAKGAEFEIRLEKLKKLEKEIKLRINESINLLNKFDRDKLLLSKELESLDKNLEKLSNEGVNEICDKCGNSLNDSQIIYLRQLRENNIIEIEVKIKNLLNEINSLESKIEHCNSVINGNEARLNHLINNSIKEVLESVNNTNLEKVELKNYLERKNDFSRRIKSLKNEINYLMNPENDLLKESDLKDLEDMLKECEESIAETEKENAELTELAENYKYFKDIVFTKKGLKAYIMNNIVITFNERIKKYLNPLGYSLSINVDLNSVSKSFNTVVKRRGVITNYESLSGGEKQRIDICVVFAMHDTLCNYSKINLLLLDEITEGLDEQGCNYVFTMLKEQKLKNCETIFLITHNDNANSLHNVNFKTFTKINNKTVLV